MQWFLLGAGLFALVTAVCDWDWFMNHPKARFMARLLGRNGTRIFYGLLGGGMIAVGVLGLVGVITMK